MNHSRPLDDEPIDDQDLDAAGEDEETPPPICGSCRQEIALVFYELGGTLLCEPCRIKVAEVLATPVGRAGRVFRAVLFGSLAGLAGCLIYYVLLRYLNLQIGLIAILVGFMVGSAVARGSNHRGGWFYQLLAIFLTYTAIAVSFSAAVLPQMIQGFQEREAEKDKLEKAEQAAGKAPQAPAPPQGPATLGELIATLGLLLILVLGLIYSLPIMTGLQSPLTLLIIGFAIWEAWKLNRRPQLPIHGPFQLEYSDAPPGLESS